MVTEEDFLLAILDNINDTTHRLVFAGWLEDRGDAHAEWLRIECELARLTPEDGRRPPLEARKRALEESYREGLVVWERRFALARIKDKVGRVPNEAAPPEPRGPVQCDLRLNPTLSESEVAAFEEEHRITLPEEYRAFLLDVGNGGMGPGDGLRTLAESAEESPTPDLDKPFPFSFRMYQEDECRFVDARSDDNEPRAHPGVLFLADVDAPWASTYLVITGEDRGLVWMCGHIVCGWNPEAPTWEGDQKQIGNPPRRFLRWYEDWLDAILPEATGGGSE